jgi:hypothetical protein
MGKGKPKTRPTDITQPPDTIRVFIGWSKPRSKAVAAALRAWLPNVIQRVEPFMSDLDIPSGERWGAFLDEKLRVADFGIICLTPENLKSSFVLFESGALAALKGRLVCPYLFDLKNTDVEAPLSFFQSRQSDENGTLQLLSTINELGGGLDGAMLEKTFKRWWEELEDEFKKIEAPSEEPPTRPLEDKVEEILTLVRAISRQRRPLRSTAQLELWRRAMAERTASETGQPESYDPEPLATGLAKAFWDTWPYAQIPERSPVPGVPKPQSETRTPPLIKPPPVYRDTTHGKRRNRRRRSTS